MMLRGKALFLALRPTKSGKERDLLLQPAHPDRRIYNDPLRAFEWLNYYAPNKPEHPGFVFEVHLDQLFQCEPPPIVQAVWLQSAERRYEFHERQMLEHASLADRWRNSVDGQPGATRLLDENDLAVLRQAAFAWLALPAAPQDRDGIDALASVLRALLNAGKLGGR